MADSEDVEINPEDIIEVLEFNDDDGADDMLAEIEDMDLNEDEDDDDDDDDDTFQPSRDDSLVTFSEHKGYVFCVDVSPDNDYVVTGGEDDFAYIWSLADGDRKLQCQGHEDSVVCAAFNHNGKYVATGDMKGDIKIWSVGTWDLKIAFECGDLQWMMWHFSADVLFAGTTDGAVWMWKVPSGECRTFAGPAAALCGELLADGKHIAVGYDDGSCFVWDLKNATSTYTMKNGHNAAINCIHSNKENSLISTGSQDATAKLINHISKKVLCTFDCSASGIQDDTSVESVKFSPTQPYLATGTLDGVVSIWDIPTQKLRSTCKHEDGVVKLTWDDTSPYLYVGTLDGAVSIWDSRSGERETQLLGHSKDILDLTLVNNSKLVTTSADGTCKVFDINTSKTR